ncbi:glycosyltransferase [Actinomyces sp. B33]|uniref:glycosyltransferase family 2 protein n=1 Tax=Actinomyces sp. B33 TaxID=2942131 RepID=UPI0023420DCA|nr:glycosyltransferase [Actinomyces sp. B33]MDC4232350.1 glycosyltransferase [Actinomyces sp. B33]
MSSSVTVSGGRTAPQRVAAILPAHNVGRDVAATVRACRAIPGVDLLIVVDDGSDDDTGRSARAAGAVVVRHSVARGRASAIETGVKVAAMRDHADWPARHLLILSPDLGESAVEATALVEAVTSGMADCACSVPPVDPSVFRGRAQRLARAAIRRATGWEPRYPLSSQRCATREAITAAMPFMSGYGLEVAMTVDILVAGLSMIEIPCNFVHSGADPLIGARNRPARLTDAAVASARKVLAHARLPVSARPAGGRVGGIGAPYPRPASERRAAEGAAAPASS